MKTMDPLLLLYHLALYISLGLQTLSKTPDMDPMTIEPELPGFRFYPTEEELLDFYLKGVLYGKRPICQIINTVNIYLHEPWELSRLAKIGEREWFFFVPRDKKHANGGRPSRTTGTGFWKATGSDRFIRSIKDPKRVIGVRKTLVFYKGRAPTGCRTDWIMNEYRMPDTYPTPKNDVVLCKIYRKATSMKVLEQRAAMEEDKALPKVGFSATEMVSWQMKTSQKEEETKEKKEYENQCENMSRPRDCMKENLPQLHLPKYNLEWIQDPYLFQSPWIQDWSLCDDLLNF